MSNANLFSIEPIDFDNYIGKSLDCFPKDLEDFCFGDPNLPLAPTLKKGVQALRIGNYKIIEEPSIRQYYNGINTHAAYVLFYKYGYQQPIKYYANVGPLMNFDAKFETEDNGVWHHFIRSGKYADKDSFFKGLLNKELRVLNDEWVHSDKFKTDVKKITWKFI
jgi:hypothetical protein